MNKIKLFITSACEEFNTELAEIGDYIRRLNDCYLDRGIYFFLVTNGDVDTGKGDEHALAVGGFDLAFFLFFTKADRDITENLEAALDHSRKNNKPKVITYLKVDEAQPPTDEITLLKERLGKDPDHYYNTYRHIDTLKLGLLMQIKQLDLDGVDIRLEDGRAWQGDKTLLSLDHVEMVSGYEDLQRLKNGRAELERGFYAAKIKYTENPDDNALYEAYYEASIRRGEAIKEIHDIEARLYHMIEGMYEQTSQGRLSRRQVEGFRLMERGLFKEAQVVLDFDAIVSESHHDETMADTIDKRAQVHVNEHLQLVEVNKTLGDWAEVDACYREAVRLEERHSLPRKAMLPYVEFLYRQKRYDEAITNAEKLLYYYEKPAEKTLDVRLGLLLVTLGRSYAETQRIAEAENTLQRAIRVLEKLAEQNPDAVLPELGRTYRILGRMYTETRRNAEAEVKYNSALEIQARLSERDFYSFGRDMADTYNSLAITYMMTERMGEAGEKLESALEMKRRLVAYNPGVFEESLVTAYINLASYYMHTQRFKESEEIFTACIALLKRLVDLNPAKHELNLAKTYGNNGELYVRTNRLAEAEDMYSASLAIQQRLASRMPAAFEPDLAVIYRNFGDLYGRTGQLSRAEEAFQTALRLNEKYADVNPTCASQAEETRDDLKNLREATPRSEGSMALLTPEEREVALLLIEGDTQRDIARRLRLPASEVSQRVKAIRDKVSMGEYDQVIAAIVGKYKLSGRETDILRCLRRNMTNAEIAAERFLSEETVRVHIHNLVKKLPVETRNDVFDWVTAFEAERE